MDSKTLPALFTFYFLLFAAACVPATVPAHLDDTPGAPVRVIDQRYEAEQFSARYPAGWRVITGPASAPLSVMFAAPDDCALILLSTTPVDAPALDCPQAELRTTRRQLDLPGAALFVSGTAPVAQWAAFAPILSRVAASVEASPLPPTNESTRN